MPHEGGVRFDYFSTRGWSAVPRDGETGKARVTRRGWEKARIVGGEPIRVRSLLFWRGLATVGTEERVRAGVADGVLGSVPAGGGFGGFP